MKKSFINKLNLLVYNDFAGSLGNRGSICTCMFKVACVIRVQGGKPGYVPIRFQ